MKHMVKWILAAVLILLPFSVVGCGKKEKVQRRDIDFTVCDETRMPEELVEIIEEKKSKVFKLTYVNNNYLYIAIGYGEHDRKNLNVVVDDLYLTDNAIYVETSLMTAEQLAGEDSENHTGSDAAGDNGIVAEGAPSMYPYIVLKCEKYELPVVFDID